METQPYDGGGFGITMILSLVFLVLVLAGLWKIFTKAGKPGWAAIVPIYNTIVLLEITGKPIWWFFLMLIPGVNIVIGIIVLHQLSRSFGQGVGMTILLILAIGYIVLGFGSAKYGGVPRS